MLILLVTLMRWLQPTLLILEYMTVGGAPSRKREDSGNVANNEGPCGYASSMTTPKGKSIRRTIAALLYQSWLFTLRTVTTVVEATTSYASSAWRPRRRRKAPGWGTYVWKTVETAASCAGDWILANVTTTQRRRRGRMITATVRRAQQTSRFLALTALAMQASATISTEREVTFDTDSQVVGIDNQCTACISHDLSDFEGNLEPSNRVVKGF
ncbi:hypothetical protein MHU86_18058 [Fragilaria crotonensis]|nr:hypothetical protein MHU86_18058 [Fragilaria crotonensis]